MPRRMAGPSSTSNQRSLSASAGCGPPVAVKDSGCATRRGAPPHSICAFCIHVMHNLDGVVWPRAVSAARSAACASFTDAGSGRSPASEKSRAAGVASAGADVHRPLEELARRRVARHLARPPSRSRGRPPAGSAPAGARPPPRRFPSPRSGGAAARRARRRPRGRAARSARRARSSDGSCTIAAAIATRWSSPPESVSVRRSSRCATPRPSAVSSTARATAPAGSPRCSSGSSSSARTPPITICVSGSWKTVPHTAASSPGPWSRTSRPPTLSSPVASPPWKCGTSPQSARSSVDLPEPDTPASTVKVPGSSSSVRSRSDGLRGLGIAVAEALGDHQRLRHGPPPSAPRGRRTARARRSTSAGAERHLGRRRSRSRASGTAPPSRARRSLPPRPATAITTAGAAHAPVVARPRLRPARGAPAERVAAHLERGRHVHRAVERARTAPHVPP